MQQHKVHVIWIIQNKQILHSNQNPTIYKLQGTSPETSALCEIQFHVNTNKLSHIY